MPRRSLSSINTQRIEQHVCLYVLHFRRGSRGDDHVEASREHRSDVSAASLNNPSASSLTSLYSCRQRIMSSRRPYCCDVAFPDGKLSSFGGFHFLSFQTDTQLLPSGLPSRAFRGGGGRSVGGKDRARGDDTKRSFLQLDFCYVYRPVVAVHFLPPPPTHNSRFYSSLTDRGPFCGGNIAVKI